MKLEPGKYYRTRNGKQAYIHFHRWYKDVSYPWVGEVIHNGTRTSLESWTSLGMINLFGRSDYDLVDKWGSGEPLSSLDKESIKEAIAQIRLEICGLEQRLDGLSYDIFGR